MVFHTALHIFENEGLYFQDSLFFVLNSALEKRHAFRAYLIKDVSFLKLHGFEVRDRGKSEVGFNRIITSDTFEFTNKLYYMRQVEISANFPS